MPIVGMETDRVISAAADGSINSRTTAKPPFSSIDSGFVEQESAFRLCSAFGPIAAFFQHVLWQHPDMSDETGCLSR